MTKLRSGKLFEIVQYDMTKLRASNNVELYVIRYLKSGKVAESRECTS